MALEKLFLTYFDVGIYGVVGCAALLIVCLVVQLLRVPSKFAAAALGLFMLRLLLPVALPSSVSLFNIPDLDSALTHAADFKKSYCGDYEIALDIPGDGGEFERVTAAGVPALEPEEWSKYPDKFDYRAAFYTVDENGNILPAPTDMEALVPTLSKIWLAGVGVMLLYGVVSWLRLRRKLRFAVPDGDVFICDELSQPCVAGFLRARIYLPAGLTEQQRRHIVCHEREHIRRGDHIVKALSWLAVCVHWYHPWMWLFHPALTSLMEEASDDGALARLGDSAREDYAESLLALSSKRRIFSPSPLSFSENDTKSRIKRLLRRKSAPLPLTVLGAVLLGAALVLCVTQPLSYTAAI